MPTFSGRSLARLKTCHSDLQRLFLAVVREEDCTIICGHREEAEQERAYREKKSKLRFPQSKHNVFPSRAVDVAFWPLDWKDIEGHLAFGRFVVEKAKALGIPIVWGGDWDGDGKSDDERFLDLVHFELGA